MLDVDGHVIAPAELIQRVEQLLQATRSSGVTAEPTGPDNGGWKTSSGEIDEHVRNMRGWLEHIHPPDIGNPDGIRGRASRLTKRTIRKLSAWYVEPRWAAQQLYDAHNVELASGLYSDVQRLHGEHDELRRRNTTLRLQLAASLERINGIRTRLEQFMADSSGKDDRFVTSIAESLRTAASHGDVQVLRDEVGRLLERLGAASAAGADIDYVAFEDRFRGSNDEVRKTQQSYLPLFPPPESPGRILDIGCGRGEMVELLRDAGHDVLGVDPDSGMVEICLAKGVPVIEDDGIHQLERAVDDSLKGIFCSQVVEHLLTSELELMVRLGVKKLRAGGVLIIETINPRSSFALGNHFYADTSHVRPVHPETLRFICEQAGFGSVALEERSLHPMVNLAQDLPDDTMGAAVDGLLRNVFGYQDYAIIATK